MNVAVTGASGFIGAALTERLRADGDEVVGIDLAGNPDRRADVSDPSATVAALGGADAIVHAAAIVAERGRMEDFVRVNVRGTRNVLDAAGPRRTVVIASVAGWGYEFRRDLDEDAPPRPVRAALRGHQGRDRDARPQARRDGDPARRRLRARLDRRG